jgi:hypothetical protein
MLLSRCAAIHEPHCNFSMDQEETANVEYLPAIDRLPDNLSTSKQQCQRYELTDIWTYSCRSPFDVRFLTLSQIPNLLAVAIKTYRVFS